MNKIQIEQFENNVKKIVKKLKDEIPYYGDLFPSANSVDGKYLKLPNASIEQWSDWTSSFYTGMIWLAYEVTGDKEFLEAGKRHIASFRKRLDERDLVDHHDLGFLYILSALAPYKICRDEDARKLAIDAAYHLTTRFHKKIGILQQNYSMTEDNHPFYGKFIIDSLMNIPLLYWAADVTGDDSIYNIAQTHLSNVLKYLWREDGSVFAFCRRNPNTGEIIEMPDPTQCWSRSLSWAVYGLTLAYHHTGERSLLEKAQKSADFYIEFILDEDRICPWDLYGGVKNKNEDSSAAAILASALLELSDALPISNPGKERYREEALKLLNKFQAYISLDGVQGSGILKHGINSLNSGTGVNEYQIWGDYYYFEALVRLLYPWRSYWHK